MVAIGLAALPVVLTILYTVVPPISLPMLGRYLTGQAVDRTPHPHRDRGRQVRLQPGHPRALTRTHPHLATGPGQGGVLGGVVRGAPVGRTPP